MKEKLNKQLPPPPLVGNGTEKLEKIVMAEGLLLPCGSNSVAIAAAFWTPTYRQRGHCKFTTKPLLPVTLLYEQKMSPFFAVAG